MSALRVGSTVPEAISGAPLLDAVGSKTRLGDGWANGACLTLFLRHFGCVGCSEEVTELAPRLEELARAGIHTVLVGNGTPGQLAAFVERHKLAGAPVDVKTDPTLAVHAALALRRSTWATFGPRAVWDFVRAFGAGHPHRGIQGDRDQQGGALLVDRHGTVRLFHVSRHLGDHVSASDLVQAALALAIEAQPDGVLV